MDVKEIIARMEKLDACAVSDALDALNSPGAVSGLQRRSTRKRIVGRVQTVKLHDTAPEGGSRRHLGTAAIEAADSQTVIVVEQRTGIDCAGWGGVLANAAQIKGVRGVIMEGPARDIDEYEDIGFPVFSRFVTTRTARGRVFEESFGTPVKVGDVVVNAGDYVIADGSGVVFVPQALAAGVLATAEAIAGKERLMTADVLAGRPVSQVMGTNYENMLNKQ
ncbi:MAG: RraA family protein [Pseudomonadales bacterium]|nr:RraA family protein [Pseudomonadales bacterium]